MIEKHESYLFRLQEWYLNQCDGVWERKFGIKIDNIDNPGWSIRIDLIDTSLEKKEFQDVRMEMTENNWILC